MPRPRKPLDIYIRVSRRGGRQHLISPTEQERTARMLAAHRGLEVGIVLPHDLDQSGGTLDRPGLQEGLRRVEARESGGLIVALLDRLSRDHDAHALVRRITDAGGAIYAPDAPEDWTTPEGELQVGLIFEIATYMRKRARAGFERAKEQAIERGIPVHTRPAVGYRVGDGRRLEPDPETAPVVAEVFARRAERAGPAALAELLESRGVTTSQGSRTWSKEAIYNLLRNRVYLGELRYGRDRDPDTGELRPRFINPSAHEPIVDVVTWQLAQYRGVRRGGPERRHVLSGLLRCGSCRHCLQGTRHSRGYRIYRCKRRHAGGICPATVRINAEWVERIVLADMWEHMPRLSAHGRNAPSGKVSKLVRNVESARAALAEWASPQMQEAIGNLDIYASGMRERRDRVGRAEAGLAAERSILDATSALPEGLSLRKAWGRMTVDDRVGLLATRYDCLVLCRDPRRLVVFPAGTGPADLPRQGYRREPTLRPFDLDGDLPDGVRVLAV